MAEALTEGLISCISEMLYLVSTVPSTRGGPQVMTIIPDIYCRGHTEDVAGYQTSDSFDCDHHLSTLKYPVTLLPNYWLHQNYLQPGIFNIRLQILDRNMLDLGL